MSDTRTAIIPTAADGGPATWPAVTAAIPDAATVAAVTTNPTRSDALTVLHADTLDVLATVYRVPGGQRFRADMLREDHRPARARTFGSVDAALSHVADVVAVHGPREPTSPSDAAAILAAMVQRGPGPRQYRAYLDRIAGTPIPAMIGYRNAPEDLSALRATAAAGAYPDVYAALVATLREDNDREPGGEWSVWDAADVVARTVGAPIVPTVARVETMLPAVGGLLSRYVGGTSGHLYHVPRDPAERAQVIARAAIRDNVRDAVNVVRERLDGTDSMSTGRPVDRVSFSPVHASPIAEDDRAYALDMLVSGIAPVLRDAGYVLAGPRVAPDGAPGSIGRYWVDVRQVRPWRVDVRTGDDPTWSTLVLAAAGSRMIDATGTVDSYAAACAGHGGAARAVRHDGLVLAVHNPHGLDVEPIGSTVSAGAVA